MKNEVKLNITQYNFSIKLYFFIFIAIIFFNQGNSQNTVGLILHDNTKSYQGYTLFGPRLGTNTYLIDNDGFLTHTWETDYNPSATAYLLENGNLLRATRGFQMLDWDGKVIWEYAHETQHHDIEPLPNGNILLITNDRKTRDEVIAAGRNPDLLDLDLKSLRIIEIAQGNSGESVIVWEWYAWDHLIQEFDSTKDNFGDISEHPELIDINFHPKDNSADWLHTNSIDYHPIFDQIIVSHRSLNEIWIIDHSTTIEEAATHKGGLRGNGGDLLYRWGNPVGYGAGTIVDQKLFGQHDARWIELGLPGAGNIMIFNNGLNRPDGAYSSIVEITPPVDFLGNYNLVEESAFEPSTFVWEFTANIPTDMYSSKYSGGQRLANGNTLICSGVGGNLIEVTETGEIVWKYINPESTNGMLTQGDAVENNDVFRVHRYSFEYSGFNGRDLTPGIKLNIEYNPFEINDFKLFNNYPNPFNPTTTISYGLSKHGHVNIQIYDIVGQLVFNLIDTEQSQGMYSVIWNGTNNQGKQVPAGIYLSRITSNNEVKTAKLMLLK